MENHEAENQVGHAVLRNEIEAPQVIEDLWQVVVRVHLRAICNSVSKALQVFSWQWLHGFLKESLYLLQLLSLS